MKKINNRTTGYKISNPEEILERIKLLNKYKNSKSDQERTNVYSYPRSERLKIKEMYPISQ